MKMSYHVIQTICGLVGANAPSLDGNETLRQKKDCNKECAGRLEELFRVHRQLRFARMEIVASSHPSIALL